jgi:hypothetical protein
MPSDAIPQPSPSGATGPRTQAGKARSARNSTRDGLFAQRDFVLEGEDEEYAQTFATEIMGATWLLRRCGILEFDLARSTDPGPDAQTAIQQSIDRARAQSHNILRRSLAELRKLQTERHTRILQSPDGEAPAGLGLTDSRPAVNAADTKPAAIAVAAPNTGETRPFSRDPAAITCAGSLEAHRPRGASPLCASSLEERWRRIEEESEASLDGSSFCKPVSAGSSFCKEPATPRNALCGSGSKYKRCCGKNAPAVLNTAA